MNPIIHDLNCDIQAPEIVKVSEIIKKDGKICYKDGKIEKKEYELDISFIPAGISIPLLKKHAEWCQKSTKYLKYLDVNGKPDIEKMKNMSSEDIDSTKENVDMQFEIIGMWTSYCNKELTAEWLKHNLDYRKAQQLLGLLIGKITEHIKSQNSKSESKKKLIGNE